ncbi:GIY-YIG nuclease family protein [Nocardia cyriacigeorgica]|uniref:GIY-YIG nuclease family protein n=1 Tax=Nocardia cyriacigeorgica TaxID=135487 RepID=UPI0024580774|nr:GIY-YIG nuclease family protein [Nocardia cyriacigeorgica]
MSSYDRPSVGRHYVGGLGYVYVLGFDNGTVKVGNTTNPGRRIGSHDSNARKYGNRITDWWLSPPHQTYVDNESELIRTVGTWASGVEGREYFQGCGFDDVVHVAKKLPFTYLDAIEVGRRLFKAEQLKTMLGPAAPRTAEFDAIQAILHPDPAAIFGGRDFSWSVDLADEADLAVVERLAELWGVSSQEISEMGFLDLLIGAAHSQLQAAAERVRLWAIQNGRTDLHPIRANKPGSHRG